MGLRYFLCFRHIEDGTDEKKLSSETGSDDSQRPVTPATASTVVLDPVNEEELKKIHRKAVINAITFVLALVVHTSLEGFVSFLGIFKKRCLKQNVFSEFF